MDPKNNKKPARILSRHKLPPFDSPLTPQENTYYADAKTNMRRTRSKQGSDSEIRHDCRSARRVSRPSEEKKNRPHTQRGNERFASRLVSCRKFAALSTGRGWVVRVGTEQNEQANSRTRTLPIGLETRCLSMTLFLGCSAHLSMTAGVLLYLGDLGVHCQKFAQLVVSRNL